MIMSTLMLASASGPKIAAATPGLSATSRSVICASSREKAMPVTTCCSTISSSSQMSVPSFGSRRIVEGRAHVELDLVHHRHFDRAHLQDLGAERGHFEHFLERHLVEPPRLRHDARVGRVDAVDVGVDVAAVGADRRGERHRRRVRAAAPERRHPVRSACRPWKPATTAISPRLKPSMSRAPSIVGDARRAVRVVGQERDLPALPRARREPHVLEHEREQAGGDEFARGDDRVVFGVVGVRARLLAPGDELVGLAGHGRDDDRDLVAGVDLAFDVARRRCGCVRRWRPTCRRISSPDATWILEALGETRAARAMRGGRRIKAGRPGGSTRVRTRERRGHAWPARPSPSVIAEEVARFDALGDAWWDPDGPMAPLHRLTRSGSPGRAT